MKQKKVERKEDGSPGDQSLSESSSPSDHDNLYTSMSHCVSRGQDSDIEIDVVHTETGPGD